MVSWVERRIYSLNNSRIRKHFNEYSSILGRNESVCVVGNAVSMLPRLQGAEIDNHVLVTRINQGKEKLEVRTSGLKTSIHCVSTPKPPAKRLVLLLKSWLSGNWTVLMSPQSHSITFLGVKLDLRPFFAFYPVEWHKELVMRLSGNQPSTGTMAIDFVLRFTQAEKLHIYGFDFWDSPQRHTGSLKHSTHSPSLERDMAYSRLPECNIH